jgi:PAS domain-containing protein
VKRNLADNCADVVRRRPKEKKVSKSKKSNKELVNINSSNPDNDSHLLTPGVSIQSDQQNTKNATNKLEIITEISSNVALENVDTADKNVSAVDKPIVKITVDDSSDSNLNSIPEIPNPENSLSAPTIKRKRGRPPKDKSTTNSTSKQQPKSRPPKKVQKLNNSKPTININVEIGSKEKEDNLNGLGVIAPSSLSLLPPPFSGSNNNSHIPLLNLANISLNNTNLNNNTAINKDSSNNLLKTENSLSNLRLPSFSDLKGPLFTGLHDIKSPHPFSPISSTSNNYTTNTISNTNNSHHHHANNALSMMGLPSISSTGLHNFLNHPSNSDIPKEQLLHHQLELQEQQRGIDGKNNHNNDNSNSDNSNTHSNQNNQSQNQNQNQNPNNHSHNHNQNNHGNRNDNKEINGKISNIQDGQLNIDQTNESQIPLNMIIPSTTKTISPKSILGPEPETPGSPLEFSVSSTSRTNTSERHNIHRLNNSQSDFDSRFANQDIPSSNNSIGNFDPTNANDEYVQLPDLLNTNLPTPRNGFIQTNKNNELITEFSTKFESLSNEGNNGNGNGSTSIIDNSTNNNTAFFDENVFDIDDDDDIDTRPFISINLENGTMISSYPNNSTPNSFVYNSDHSQMPNTAKEIPKDFEQNDNYTSPLIMRHVIKQPDDIYLTNIVKAYQYPIAYHALIAYLKKRFNKRQLLEIAKCMAKYRPSFISATKNLYENDLIFTERSLQRTLLEYESLISISPSPTIIWRRTGEIVALTNEFAVMTGYSKMSLLTKRTFIVELMDDESTINYFKSFSEFAFGDLNATYLTDCNLRKAEDDNYLRCCCVWTIKRDVFDIPMLIVGQFLPVLE